MAFGRALIGPEEQNRLIDAGLAKANQVLFGTAKATTTDAGNFRVTQYGAGGPGVIAGLSQETKNAEAANAAQLATARLTNTKADVLPAESAATVNETAARAGLLGQQAKYFGPTANAAIGAQNAAARLTGTQADTLVYDALSQDAGNLPQSRAARESFLLSTIPAAQRPFYRLNDAGTGVTQRTAQDKTYPYALPAFGR